MQEVIIPYTPRYPQDEIHAALETHRFAVLVAHRRMGKTVLSVNHLIKRAIIDGKERGFYAYLAPYRVQAEQIAWGYLKHYTAPIPGIKVNEQKLMITLPTGVSIRIYGADNPDSLRGAYFDGVVLDEVAQMKPEVWGEILRPALADRNGWAVFIGTPKGINLFSQTYDRALERMAAGDPEWIAMLYDVNRTHVIGAKELEALKVEMSENEFRQEFLCDFNAAADNALISIDLVREAATREYREHQYANAPRVMGVDVARFGSDSTVIFKRQGLVAWDPIVIRKSDNMSVADRVAIEMAEFKPDATFIDLGEGSGVIDRLRQLGFDVTEVAFGGAANRADIFANRRVEMWWQMAEWLRLGGAIPKDTLLQADLCAPTYGFTTAGKKILEPKDKIKERIGRSPDCFVAGTVVLTPDGNVPIETITPGDKVITPRGERTVLRVWKTETSVLTTVKLNNGNVIVGKPSHKVFGSDLKAYRMDSIPLYNGIASASLWSLVKWNILNQLFIRESDFSFKRRADTILPAGKVWMRDFYIGAYGLSTSALFLRACMCITKTAIGLITGLRIWSLSLNQPTKNGTCENECKTLNSGVVRSTPSNEPKNLQKNGTQAKKERSGTQSTESNLGKGESPLSQFALYAERNTRRFSLAGQDSAQEHANKRKDTSAIKRLLEFAHGVARSLSLTSIGIKSVAPVLVQTECVPQKVETYNLTLDDDNVYFANGILVENCADALALTFASPVAPRISRHLERNIYSTHEYDPDKEFEDSWRR